MRNETGSTSPKLFYFLIYSVLKKKTVPILHRNGLDLIVRKKGLEPPRREAPDPKSGAATNYATSAVGFIKDCKNRN